MKTYLHAKVYYKGKELIQESLILCRVCVKKANESGERLSKSDHSSRYFEVCSRKGSALCERCGK